MRLMFVHYVKEDRGSAQDMHHYVRAARALGHEVALYGRPKAPSAFNYSLDMGAADAVIFIVEWTTELQYGDNVDFARLVGGVPRRRRVVIDCDGGYNDAINVVGDFNHADAARARRWVEVCDSLSDKVFQPTYHPLRPNARPFFFHAYNPAWEVPLDFRAKEFGMVYVGNNWFRWRPLQRVLRAVERVREEVGRIALVGHGWDTPAPWAKPTLHEDAYRSDPAYLRRLGVEVFPPVRFDQVLDWMGKGVFSLVVYRPLFDHLRLVTCRSFETPAAGAIPLFAQEPAFVAEVYGEEAVELVLPQERPEEKVLDLLRRPEYYADVVRGIRHHLARQHSYQARLRELIEIVES
jgi:SAM-dependent methyltransferase